MSSESDVDRNITADVNIGGSNTGGNIVIGSSNRVVAGAGNDQSVRVTAADRAELEALFAELRTQIERDTPSDHRDAALERADELKGALAGDKPDLTTIEYVRAWFVKYVPGVAGAVVSVLVNPIVGKLVEAAGEMTADAFRRRFEHKA